MKKKEKQRKKRKNKGPSLERFDASPLAWEETILKFETKIL